MPYRSVFIGTFARPHVTQRHYLPPPLPTMALDKLPLRSKLNQVPDESERKDTLDTCEETAKGIHSDSLHSISLPLVLPFLAVDFTKSKENDDTISTKNEEDNDTVSTKNEDKYDGSRVDASFIEFVKNCRVIKKRYPILDKQDFENDTNLFRKHNESLVPLGFGQTPLSII